MGYIKTYNFENNKLESCTVDNATLCMSSASAGFSGHLTLGMDVLSIGYEPITYTIVSGTDKAELSKVPSLLQLSTVAFNYVRDYIINLTSEAFYDELVGCISSFNSENATTENPITFASGLYYSQYADNISGMGIITPNGSAYGSEVNNDLNVNAPVYQYVNVNTHEYQHNLEFYNIIDILQIAIDNGIGTFSDAVKDFIGSRKTKVISEKAVHYDVYINSFKLNTLMGGYQLNSIEIRWTCPVVNICTEEYLQQFPDYKYRANNTKIRIGINQTSDKSIPDEVGQVLYGNKLFKVTKERMYQNSVINAISSVIVTDSVADKFIVVGAIFEGENEVPEHRCTAQIPLNKLYGNVDNLITVNGIDGSTITLHWGAPTEAPGDDVVGWSLDDYIGDWGIDDTQKDDPDEGTIPVTPGTNSNISVLTKSYAISNTELEKVGNKLWSGSFYDDIELVNNSPIENIVSCKSFPFNIGGNPNSNVKLGNVDTGANGYLLQSSFNPILNVGHFKVSKKFSGHLDWLNYPPYTTVQIFTPYCGYHDIDVTPYLDKDIYVQYIYDVITGVCSVNLKCNNIEFAKYTGSIAIDIPIASSNRAQVETGYVMGGINAAANLLTGNLIGAFTSGAQALMQPYHTNVSGSPSPSCDAFDNQQCFVIVNYPVYYEPDTFKHQFGYPCNKTLKLDNKNGFIQTENVDVKGFNCTDDEREEIKRLLDSGVYF